MTNIAKNRNVKHSGLIKLKDLKLHKLQEAYPNFPYPPIPKYSDKTSNGLTKCVIDWINLNGYQAERISSTGRKIDNTKIVTDCIGRKRSIGQTKWIKGSGTPGTADISSTILGRSVKIEIKCKATGDRYQSEAQKNYQKEVETAGGIYLIVRTFQGFYEWYQEFTKTI
ncbi:hypothetical protein SAMN05444483_10995 [Salegentibacter echinorum]|uniref:VRR-NUC domain-containing protein n=1 Tax=Salegentibacter echinorum TaxID=1073325 RepID=A0A1M5J306_SALEC|nr:hypothetical protein [Salegentibacter echinorum]SHG34976.1 hypothetical protein SAMN05444483_10995 [Salegentibacter echinorum]